MVAFSREVFIVVWIYRPKAMAPVRTNTSQGAALKNCAARAKIKIQVIIFRQERMISNLSYEAGKFLVNLVL